jgi:hypothetical protein
MARPAVVVVPFLHHLLHRPRPRPEVLVCGAIRWRCSCGASWLEPPAG